MILFSGGRAPTTVQASNSPFTGPVPAGASAGTKAQELASGVTSFLIGKQDKPAYVSAYVPLSTRSVRLPPPTLISPRESKLLGAPVVFEWSGSESQRYGVRVFGPDHAVTWGANRSAAQGPALPRFGPGPQAGRALRVGAP